MNRIRNFRHPAKWISFNEEIEEMVNHKVMLKSMRQYKKIEKVVLRS